MQLTSYAYIVLTAITQVNAEERHCLPGSLYNP